MKPILSILCFSLISLGHLSAQFHFKVSLDEYGLYSVKLKSDVIVNPGSIVGSGQISLNAPFGGFKIGNIESVRGVWSNDYEILGKEFNTSLEKEYFLIWLEDGIGILSEGLAIGEEVTLIRFRNIGVCTGSLELLTPTDPLAIMEDSLRGKSNSIFFHFSAGHHLDTYDPIEEVVYKVTGTYDGGETICEQNNPELSTSTENLKLKNSIRALPNPFSNHVLIRFDNRLNKEYWLTVNDLSGREVRQISGLTGNQVTLQRGDMRAGMYIAQLRDDTGNFAAFKIIVH